MRKIVASTTIAASLIGGGVGAIVLGPTVAGAQDESTAGSTASGLDAVLDGLVTDGTLTQAQADAVQDAIETAAQEGRLGHRRGPGFGHRGGFGLRGTVLEELGLDAETVRSGLADGMTLGEIADANGSSADAVVDALVEQMTERLDAAVEAGRVDATDAADKAAEIEQRATDIVSGEIEPGRRGSRGFGGMRGDHHHGDSSADADAEPTST